MNHAAPRPDRHTLDTIDRWLAYRVWYSRLPGAQVAIGRRGEIWFRRSYGLADVSTAEALRDDHRFHVASHSKTFTAAAVLQLAESGLLGLEDPIGRHVPELAGGELAEVSLRELVEHTGGLLRDGRDADHWQGLHPFPDREQLLAMTGPKTAPGTRFAYSNLGYGLLGLAIEAVTGQDYATAVTERLLRPLGLAATTPSYRSEDAEHYATGHTGLHQARERRPLPHVDTRALDAATGFGSTATDLVRWFSALALDGGVEDEGSSGAGRGPAGEQVLSERSRRRMHRTANHSRPDAEGPDGYGLGLVTETIGGHRTVGHSGGYLGHITRTLLDPETGVCVSVLTNAVDGPAAALAGGVLRLLDAAAEHPAGEAPPAEELAYLGRWHNSWSVLDVGRLGSRLVATHPAAPVPLEPAPVLLHPEADHLVISAGDGYGSVGETVTLEQAPEGDRLRFGGTSMTRWDDLTTDPTLST